MRKVLILVALLALLGAACSDSSSDSSKSSNSSSSNSDSSSSVADEVSTTTPLPLTGKTNDAGTQDATGHASIDVEMDDFYFQPTFIKVTSGQALTVHLSNAGANAHTFTAPALSIDETLQPGETRDVAVTIGTGANEFHCNFHQAAGMQGGFFI